MDTRSTAFVDGQNPAGGGTDDLSDERVFQLQRGAVDRTVSRIQHSRLRCPLRSRRGCVRCCAIV